MRNTPRRLFLKSMGLTLTLPLFNTFAPLSAFAQTTSGRKNFIGVFFPNGSYFPVNDRVGAWHWNDTNGVLHSLKDGPDPVDSQVMILRDLYSGFADRDPHWQNCAGFLSSGRINLDLQDVRCAKTIDQYIADQRKTPIRSIEIGAPYYHQHLLADHPTYSHIYMNRISWKSETSYLTPETDPYIVFSKLFGGSSGGSRQFLYLNANKKSVLDSVVSELGAISNRTSTEGKLAMDEYTTSLREIEKALHLNLPQCQGPDKLSLSYNDININYVDRIQQLQKMLVFAMKCDLTNVGTIMYAPAVSELMDYAGDIGAGARHHNVAHHGDSIAEIDRLKKINRMHLGLLKHLINLLKTNGLLADSLVLYGSDMSNGNIHTQKHLPTLLCGQGADLKFGQEINFPQEQLHSKLLNSVLSMYGITLPSIGDDLLKTSANLNAQIKAS